MLHPSTTLTLTVLGCRLLPGGAERLLLTAELGAVRQSMLLQPLYFAMPFAVAFESEHLLVVDKPFDIQIGPQPLLS